LLKMLRRIISGGQTGADRAGLDFAIHVGLEHGGYVPKGRKAEDGKIAERYNLVELSTTSYPARTKRNIEESDGTVIFSLERLLSGGTKLTWKGSVVLCDSVTFPIEKVFVEFEDEHLAISLWKALKQKPPLSRLMKIRLLMLRHVSFKKSTNWRGFLVTKRGLKKCLPYYGKTTGFMAKTLPLGKRPVLSALQSCTMMA